MAPLLERYLDGDLAATAAATVATHLAECPICRAEVERERILRDSLAGLPELSLTTAQRQKVAQVSQRRRRLPWPRIQRLAPQRSWRWRALPVASALLIIITWLALLAPRQRTSHPAAPYSQAEILAARQQAKYTLVFALQLVNEAEKEAVADLFGDQLPQTIMKSLPKTVSTSRGGEG
jgi:anti-sigma factor RsiW